jgi:Peptidase family M1 domain
MMRRRWLLCLAAVLSVLPLPVRCQEPTAEEFIGRFREALESKDLPRYLDAFAPDIREEERQSLASRFEGLGMETVFSRSAGLQTDAPGEARAFLQVLFRNSYSAIVETWQLGLANKDGLWQVVRKSVTGSLDKLLRIELPPDGAERVSGVEIDHADIRLSFSDAALFHDNVPGLETAFVVVGRGHVRFAPSDPIERHQLTLIYKNPVIEDRIVCAYIRCSDAFFKTHVNIRRDGPQPLLPVTRAETAKAEAVFLKAYPRSFTIQNSLSGETLSFLPQGNEAVIEFDTARTGALTYIYHPFSDEEVNLYDRSKERIVSLYSPRNEEEPKGRRLFISAGERVDVQHYKIDVEYDPAQSYLSARAAIRVLARSEGVDGMKFRFHPDLEILRVFDEKKRELFYTVDKGRKFLYVYFAEPPVRNTPVQVEILYRGKLLPTPPTTDVVAQTAAGENRFLFQPRYRTSFYTHASFWYPGPATDDYFTSELKVIVPPEYQCVSNGELVATGRLRDTGEVAGIRNLGNATYTFRTGRPVKYLSFIVGKFNRLQEGTDPVPLRTMSSTEIVPQRKAYFDAAGDILRSYVDWFGPYPYEGLSVVQRLWPEAGGHSPASFVVLNELPWLGDRHVVLSGDSPVDLSRWKEYFLAHEIAHQWWGQGVTWGTYRDQWISEGMAQFAAILYIRKRYGEGAFVTILKQFARWTDKKSVKGPILLGSRLSFFDFSAYQSIVYDKAALALNLLRELLGDEAFFRGLKDLFESRKYGPVRTGQFREALERTSGRDLGAFFDGWFYSYGLPKVRTSWAVEPDGPGEALRVDVHQNEGVFVFPLWIEWYAGLTVHRQMVIVDSVNASFRLKLDGKPSRVRFNPDKAVPGKFD